MDPFLEQLQHALSPGYELGPELAGGGMSRVFTATDRVLGRRVVVKVLPPELAAGVNRERFRREIQLAAHLQHPHIVPLLAAGEHGSILYYTMPFIEGESLRARLERQGRLSVREVLRILHDVVDALAYAHGRGVVHRDIKPGNILTQGQHALVTDFGVAKALSAALPGPGMTSSGMAIGTPAYMAPEQLAADPAADHRVDLYAVGLLAYELLSGESPFAGPSPTATMAAQLTRDPPPLDAVRADVPGSLSRIIMRCLAKDANARPATAEALLAELDEIPLRSEPTAPTRMVAAGSGAHRRQRRVLLTALGAVVAGAAVVAVATRSRGPSAEVEHAAEVAAEQAMAGESGEVLAVPSPAPAPAPAPATRVLTREDSIAIARAVRAQLGQASTPADPAAAPESAAAQGARELARGTEELARLGKLREKLQGRMVDSIVRASLAEWSRPVIVVPNPPNMKRSDVPGAPAAPGAARRIAILEPEAQAERPDVAKLGRATSREIRRALHDRDRGRDRDRFVIVASDSAADVTAQINVIPLPGDSVVVLVKLRDRSAAPPFAYRVAAIGATADVDAHDSLPRLGRSSANFVAEMSDGPRLHSTEP